MKSKDSNDVSTDEYFELAYHIIVEYQDRQARQRNIIIFRLSEPSIDLSKDEKSAVDLESVKQILISSSMPDLSTLFTVLAN